MNNKILKYRKMLLLIIIVFVCCIRLNVKAEIYTNQAYSYSISIPYTYNQVSTTSYTNSKGENINIQKETGTDNREINEKDLNGLVEGLNAFVDNYRDELKAQLIEKNSANGNVMSKEEINKYVSSFKLESIIKKEITNATKNNYKCIHIIAKYSMGDFSYYVEQYAFKSKTDCYILSITSQDLNKFQSTEIKNVVNSFTIINATNNSSTAINKSFIQKNFNKISIVSILIILSIVLLGIIIYLINKKENIVDSKQEIEDNGLSDQEKSKEITENIKNKKDKVLSKDNNKKTITNYCVKCGKKVSKEWEFCKYCGTKLK